MKDSAFNWRGGERKIFDVESSQAVPVGPAGKGRLKRS
jgi:hypothetical protein